ncbi:MAG: hypothetical protein AAF561_08475 [Planctomycetota bacterium]
MTRVVTLVALLTAGVGFAAAPASAGECSRDALRERTKLRAEVLKRDDFLRDVHRSSARDRFLANRRGEAVAQSRVVFESRGHHRDRYRHHRDDFRRDYRPVRRSSFYETTYYERPRRTIRYDHRPVVRYSHRPVVRTNVGINLGVGNCYRPYNGLRYYRHGYGHYRPFIRGTYVRPGFGISVKF